MKDLTEIRKEIDEIDRKLLELFEYRMKLSLNVAEYKKKEDLPVYDPEREKEKLKKLRDMVKIHENADAVSDLFTQIMLLSRRAQYNALMVFDDFGFEAVENFGANIATKIAYYGEIGSYTEQAMLEYFKGQGTGIAMKTFEEVMMSLKNGQADYGVLPIENSSTGTLSDIFDLLAEYDNYIIGEHVVTVDHNLWGLPGADISKVKRVYSHPQALLQCSDFLKKHPYIEQIEGGSTASCARRILQENDLSQAAIASKRAGEAYGLELLQTSIHNEEHNRTRFIIISNKRRYLSQANRISICFVLPHRSGALYHILSHFIHNNVNLTRIESRPTKGKAFSYRFFVDFEGSLNNAQIKNALYSIKQEALELKILGSYIPI
ncbi:MAG TPA: prephenate dehydratase [Clostridiales bacterium]|jgi:chorismate mutase/prephenate dehydratase|nr:prephenate dehydratase [Clostridiales bacterium]